MNMHTNERLVRFRNPFRLDAVDEDFPAGDYIIQTLIESVNKPPLQSYRALATKLVVKPDTAGQGAPRMVDIDPLALHRAFAQDSRKKPEKVGVTQ